MQIVEYTDICICIMIPLCHFLIIKTLDKLPDLKGKKTARNSEKNPNHLIFYKLIMFFLLRLT